MDRSALETVYQNWQNSMQKWGRDSQCAIHDYCTFTSPWSIHDDPYYTFLFWHRAFLYFHERNLAYAVNSAFTLPYWNWELPDCLLNAPFCGIQPAAGNPFAKLTPSLNWPGITDTTQIPDVGELLSMPPDQFIQTLLPFHEYIHDGLAADMSFVAKSAADPIFYPFHANFDRIWMAYRKRAPAHYQILPNGLPDMFFFDQKTCHENGDDPAKGWVSVAAADFADCEEQLGYTYDISNLVPTYNVYEIPGTAEFSRLRHPIKPSSLLRIALYDIALPDVTPGVKWQVLVRGSARTAKREFTTRKPHASGHAMKQTYPYLLLDLSGIADPADFVHKKLQFFLMREGGQSTELAARKIYQIWTPKRL